MEDQGLVVGAVVGVQRGERSLTCGDGADEGIAHEMNATATVGRDPDVARRTDRGAPRGLGLMTFGKPRDDESVAALAVVEGTQASCMATCSTLRGQTVLASADTIIVKASSK